MQIFYFFKCFSIVHQTFVKSTTAVVYIFPRFKTKILRNYRVAEGMHIPLYKSPIEDLDMNISRFD